MKDKKKTVIIVIVAVVLTILVALIAVRLVQSKLFAEK